MDVSDLRSQTARHGQKHLFTFWDDLDETGRQALLADVAACDFGLLDTLIETHVRSDGPAAATGRPSPPPCLPVEPGGADQVRMYAQARDRGRRLIGEGKVAAMVVAGGQGTRLGFDGPKGAFAISPIRNKTLFRLFAESLLATERRFGSPIRWYVMTSPVNDGPTRDIFAEHEHFGLDAENVFFFQQGVMPAVDEEGRILLDEKHRVAMSPDGHGGSLRALAASGALADMADRGIEIISYFQVDNPLVRPVDPLFVGLHDSTGSQMSSLMIGKASDDERVGVFATVDGKLQVIEYTDLPEELSRARNADGSRMFDAANIAIHILGRSFVEELTRPGSTLAMPWHRARKKVSYVDPSTGRKIEPGEPNATKFEMFVFDALPLAANPLLLEARRGEVFSPVKNADGVDSAATARRDMSSRAAAWLEQCGVEVPRKPDGEADCVVEISSLFALDAEELGESLKERPVIARGGELYLGPGEDE
ncbi:MAG TPA: UDPGP type 1 family protein [Phycisphaerae bacterium]|nr:UDPGP type 1 family protein [Phycisphaerae bacterium]